MLRRRKDLEATSVVTVQNDGDVEHTEVSVERHWSQVPDEVGTSRAMFDLSARKLC